MNTELRQLRHMNYEYSMVQEVNKLRLLMKRLGLSQKDISIILGMTEGAVSRWLTKDPNKRREPNGAVCGYIDMLWNIFKGVL